MDPALVPHRLAVVLRVEETAGRPLESPLWRLFFSTGFLGGYTTFSSYAWEALSLAEGGAWIRAAAYVLGSNLAGLMGVWPGANLAHRALLSQ